MDPRTSQAPAEDRNSNAALVTSLLAFGFSTSRQRYINLSTNLEVTPAQLRQVIDQVIDGSSAVLARIAERFQAGEITLDQWLAQTAQVLKSLHLATAAAAQGGFAQMTPSKYGLVGSLIKKQYGYLGRFSQEIKTGQVVTDGAGFLARVALYAQAARNTNSEVEEDRQDEAGSTESRRILGGSKPCDDCAALARQDWQPIGDLPAIGDGTSCQVNCRCEMEFR